MRLAFLCAALCIGLSSSTHAAVQEDVFGTGGAGDNIPLAEAAFAYRADHSDVLVAAGKRRQHPKSGASARCLGTSKGWPRAREFGARRTTPGRSQNRPRYARLVATAFSAWA
jgi:hypothetical protein